MKKLNLCYRLFSMATIALMCLVATKSAFAQKAECATHDGKIVSIASDKLVMTGEDGQEHSHSIASDAKLMLDGKACKLADLKAGAKIRVMTHAADKNVASRIEGLNRNLEFISNRHDGKIVSITADKLVMTGLQGKEEHTMAVNPDAMISCDGKNCKSTDLKPGMRIRVTYGCDESKTVAHVEALDKNQEFASNFHDGSVVSVNGDKLVLTLAQGKEERACDMRSDVKITCDGKVCKSADLKPGMRIRVTLENDAPQAAARIEAINKNTSFASL